MEFETFQLQIDTIQERLNSEIAHMDEVRDMAREQYRSHNETITFYDNNCAPKLEEIFKTILKNEQLMNALLAEGKNADATEPNERIQAIRDNLKEENFNHVAEYIIKLHGMVDHGDQWKSMNVDEQAIYFVTLLKTYLFDDFVSKSRNRSRHFRLCNISNSDVK